MFKSVFVSCSNHTLLSMPMPLHDAAQSLKPQTEQHLRKVRAELSASVNCGFHCLVVLGLFLFS